MTLTAKVTLTGVQDIDALLEVEKWAGALTFSFPTKTTDYRDAYTAGEPFKGFAAFTAGQQSAARQIFAHYASVANLTFTEATGAAAATADLRLARTSHTGVGHGYTPTLHLAGGDSWYQSGGTYALGTAPKVGEYHYHVLLHEIGHTVGLKHAHEAYTAASHGVARPAMTAAHDSIEFTAMTYRSYVGAAATGYTNEEKGFPQTLMMYDIAALQHMYGANFTTNASNSTYRWNASTGEMSINGAGQGAPAANRVFLTLWDGGGNDTYDFSNHGGGISVDLRPGEWSTISKVQLGYLGRDHYARGNIANALQHKGDARSLIENAVGGSGNDALGGNQAVNRLTGGGGNDQLDGRQGADILSGGAGDDTYLVDNSRDRLVETASGGIDSVRSTVSFALATGVDHLTLGGHGALSGTGNAAANRITGNGGANALAGAGGIDTLTGGAGDDKLNGGLASDRITGGTGADTIVFDTALGRTNVDQILDFERVDTIMLDRDVFAGLRANGTLALGAFRAGTAARDADDRILYDGATGNIFYDADGNGVGAAILFAKVDSGTALTNADFVAFI